MLMRRKEEYRCARGSRKVVFFGFVVAVIRCWLTDIIESDAVQSMLLFVPIGGVIR